jgi:hypothetical protein
MRLHRHYPEKIRDPPNGPRSPSLNPSALNKRNASTGYQTHRRADSGVPPPRNEASMFRAHRFGWQRAAPGLWFAFSPFQSRHVRPHPAAIASPACRRMPDPPPLCLAPRPILLRSTVDLFQPYQNTLGGVHLPDCVWLHVDKLRVLYACNAFTSRPETSPARPC